VRDVHLREAAAADALADDVATQPPLRAHARILRRRLAAALGLGAALVAGPVAAAEVLVWPRAPDAPVADAEAAVRRAGHRVVDFAPLRARLRDEERAAAADVQRVLAALERGLADARTAYLEQRYDDMISGLLALEADVAATLRGGDLCVAAVWELEFQLGLAHGARARPGDDARARDRYALAFAVDGARRPEAALYGPDVGFAFLQAVDQQAGRPARPLPRALDPADAVVHADCRPLAAQAGLRPGLHLLRVDAPGRRGEGRVVDTRDGELRVRLAAGGELGATWAAGGLDPGGVSGRAAIRAAAGAVPVLWLDSEPGHHVARLLVDGDARKLARGDDLGDVVAVALAPLRPAPPARPRRRAGLWLGLGGAALVGVALGLGLGLGLQGGDARLQLVVP
jgi:hypothetical protein